MIGELLDRSSLTQPRAKETLHNQALSGPLFHKARVIGGAPVRHLIDFDVLFSRIYKK